MVDYIATYVSFERNLLLHGSYYHSCSARSLQGRTQEFILTEAKTILFLLSSPPFPNFPPSLHLNPARGWGALAGERCKLPHRGLGRSTSRNRIWRILALKYDIWRQPILMIFLRTNWPNFCEFFIVGLRADLLNASVSVSVSVSAQKYVAPRSGTTTPLTVHLTNCSQSDLSD